MSTHGASLIDVARAAGVSTATAGRALGGYGQVSDRTRERVLAAAAELGYRTNGLARSMVTGSTQTIGVVVTDVANPFFATALRGITDVTSPAGFEVLLANTGGTREAEQRAVTVMSEKRVDGMIVAAAQPGDGAHLKHAMDVGVPVVLLDRQVTGVPDADTITIDNEHAAAEAVAHLLELGHRRIGVITEAGDQLARVRSGSRRRGLFPSAVRLRGYVRALQAAGIEIDERLVAPARYERESAYDAMTSLLDSAVPPTAVLCTDNVLASGAYRAAQDRGLSMPADLSLVGFDDEPWTTLVRPELTIVEQPTYDLGARAGRQLLDRLAGSANRSPQHVQLKAKLVVRESTARYPASPQEDLAREERK
ncbi:LacI family transcriptional regulator [Amycolatopsis bartoniae]|uniref:LacI family transcriptional regulator n=1 Tax=Amycolatopsis bartoniae TaxID=941986 RepID=A0A8H9J0G3_9PSEU|nr:LacI family DNA-binding transcriptional regulator [Amycolatopsis bartoniae]MBB2936465.1 LacI family transcriptional regulator [Amycolatopsis bartoniae]TVT11050.1 LacI family transcriptional regulator [Amycolatopsis bartoniae]GHF68745.1 LacI family transcriptional regulator [Amycolatopsis bartoniae]